MTDNTLINPGFETGDTTGWDYTYSVANIAATQAQFLVGADYKNGAGSNYGAALQLSQAYGYPDIGDWIQIDQPLTLSSTFASIKFDIKGSVTRVGDGLQVTVYLGTGPTEEQTWTSVYSRIFTGVDNPYITGAEVTKADIEAAGVVISEVSAIRFLNECVAVS